jgi:SWI/SNF-related matrix-associated actin-dependent regulator 1 of chromatin subfamily A
MSCLRPKLARSFTYFAKRYCNARRTRWTPLDTRGQSRADELSWLLSRAFMVRRSKATIMNLPPKVGRVLYCAADPSAIDVISDLKVQYRTALNGGSDIRAAVSDLYRATCAAKISSASATVVGMAQDGGGVLAFAHHRAMLDAIQEAAQAAGLRWCRIDGGVGMAARQEVVARVQSGDTDVAILSMGAAGTGLTLTAVHRVIFCELPWDPATLRQCEDRVHRIGQEAAVSITYLLCQDTLDDYVWNKVLKKATASSACLGGT